MAFLKSWFSHMFSIVEDNLVLHNIKCVLHNKKMYKKTMILKMLYLMICVRSLLNFKDYYGPPYLLIL